MKRNEINFDQAHLKSFKEHCSKLFDFYLNQTKINYSLMNIESLLIEAPLLGERLLENKQNFLIFFSLLKKTEFDYISSLGKDSCERLNSIVEEFTPMTDAILRRFISTNLRIACNKENDFDFRKKAFNSLKLTIQNLIEDDYFSRIIFEDFRPSFKENINKSISDYTQWINPFFDPKYSFCSILSEMESEKISWFWNIVGNLLNANEDIQGDFIQEIKKNISLSELDFITYFSSNKELREIPNYRGYAFILLCKTSSIKYVNFLNPLITWYSESYPNHYSENRILDLLDDSNSNIMHLVAVESVKEYQFYSSIPQKELSSYHFLSENFPNLAKGFDNFRRTPWNIVEESIDIDCSIADRNLYER